MNFLSPVNPNCYHRFLVIVLAVTIPICASGQETYEQILIGFDPVSGAPSLIKAEMMRLARPLEPSLQLLADDEIQHELEISPEQKREIALFQSRYQDADSKLNKGFEVNDDAEEREKLQKEYAELIQELRDDYAELLFPHQTERLEELYYRVVFEQQGLRKFVEKVAASRGVTLSPQDMEKVDTVMNEFEGKLHVDIADAYRKFIEKLTKQIPDCEQYLQEFSKKATLVSIDILFVDLSQVDKLEMKTSEDELRELLATVRWMKMDPLGNWKDHPITSMEASSGLFVLVRDLSKESGGLLGEDQVAAISELSKAFSEEQQDIMSKRREMLLENKTPAEASSYSKVARKELDDKYFGRVYHDIFFDAQRQWLIDFLRMREATRHGVMGVLYLETTKDNQAITAKARVAMRTTLKKECTAFRKEIIALYQESVDTQTRRLPDSIKREVQEILGKQPEFILPNLTLVLDRVSQRPVAQTPDR